MSNLIVSRLREYDYEGIYEKNQEKNMNKTIKYLREKEKKELEECTFQPKLFKNKNTPKTTVQRYLLLHEDSILREKKAQEQKEFKREK